MSYTDHDSGFGGQDITYDLPRAAELASWAGQHWQTVLVALGSYAARLRKEADFCDTQAIGAAGRAFREAAANATEAAAALQQVMGDPE